VKADYVFERLHDKALFKELVNKLLLPRLLGQPCGLLDPVKD